MRDQLERLALPGWQLEVRPTSRRGLTATAVDVTVPDQDHHQPWSRIDALLADGGLESAVADGARRTFAALARAEASVHGIDVDQVNFHEVGALDAIVDVVGAWAALWSLGDAAMPTVASAPVGLGSGTAPMAHGVLPVPAPAVLELLTGHPTTPVDTGLETATPTGVALLVTMADRWGGLPDGVVRASGRGAGTADPPTHPNVLAVVLTDPALADPSPSTGQRVAARLIQTNLDDVTGEVVAHVIDRAIGEGADDAWPSRRRRRRADPGCSSACSVDPSSPSGSRCSSPPRPARSAGANATSTRSSSNGTPTWSKWASAPTAARSRSGSRSGPTARSRSSTTSPRSPR